jgi:hypothetical protein
VHSSTSTTLWLTPPLHDFDHVHLDFGYYGTKGLSSAWFSSRSIRTGVPTAGDTSPLFSGLTVRVAAATTAGGC